MRVLICVIFIKYILCSLLLLAPAQAIRCFYGVNENWKIADINCGGLDKDYKIGWRKFEITIHISFWSLYII